MKDIFSELYKKVLSFFNQDQKEENSKDTACNRLKLVLMQDRAKMEPALMEKMREEMIAVISKYVEIDQEALDLNLEAEGESFALMLNIPVLRAKTREEVEAAEGIVSDDDDDDDNDSFEDEDEDEEDIESEDTESSEEDTEESSQSVDENIDEDEAEDTANDEKSDDEGETSDEEISQKDDTPDDNQNSKNSSRKKKTKHQKNKK